MEGRARKEREREIEGKRGCFFGIFYLSIAVLFPFNGFSALGLVLMDR
jgi:hypothetical protein